MEKECHLFCLARWPPTVSTYLALFVSFSKRFFFFQLNRHDLFWQSHENIVNENARKTGSPPPRISDDVKHLVSAMLTVEPAHR